MPVFPIPHQKRPGKSALVTFPFLRHLDMGTLALVLFAALTLLNTVCTKGPATMEWALAKARPVEVNIDHVSFSPKTTKDTAPYILTSRDNQFQQPPRVKTERSFSKTFATGQGYSYFCSIHPRMTREIIVK